MRQDALLLDLGEDRRVHLAEELQAAGKPNADAQLCRGFLNRMAEPAGEFLDCAPLIERMHAAMPSVTVETWDPPSDVQRLAYNRGLEIMASEGVDWCAFIDTDEFIGNGDPDCSESFVEMLDRHKNHYAIGLNWAIFGSSGHIKRPEGLVQESFLRRENETFSPNRHIKSIVRPRYTKGAHHAHGFALDYPYFTDCGYC